ncbi:hypothetical protein SCLCIDRAFT_1216390 [Scleroderma citrinum Foug A]|uniref:Uncharacterized protein n=1 Tax=Scleroderma citrinum Foug A TaxID=1036808 RepID=A0A0C2ZGT5_9AGAM|nr:hypothetical protein SCLCIDRAFT_1216390 [Scleroderma citrinum Foug A]
MMTNRNLCITPIHSPSSKLQTASIVTSDIAVRTNLLPYLYKLVLSTAVEFSNHGSLAQLRPSHS